MGVRRGDLLWLLETRPEAGRKTAQVLANQYRELFLGTRRLALSGSASGRLVRLLPDWAAPASDGSLPPCFTMVFTHEELANMAPLPQRLSLLEDQLTRQLEYASSAEGARYRLDARDVTVAAREDEA